MSAGRFVWRELVSPHIATDFYTQLFGWTAKEVDMGGMAYTLFHDPTLGEDVAGAMKPMMEGVPPHWFCYVTVTDLEAAKAAILAQGGAVLTPTMAAEGVGTWFVAQDRAGATFAPFIGAQPGSTPDRRPPLGTFCWSELMTNDLDRAVPFYTAVFGWSAAPMGPVTVLSTGEVQRASVHPYPPGTTGMPDQWLNYVAVADTDAAFAKAVALGARVIVPPSDMGEMGRFAVITDPGGAGLALWQAKQ